MTVAAALDDVVAALDAAGVRATVDPAAAHPPVVLLAPTGAQRAAAPGCWVVDVEARLLYGGPAVTSPAWPWGDTLDRVALLTGATDVDVDDLPDGTRAVVVRFQLHTNGA